MSEFVTQYTHSAELSQARKAPTKEAAKRGLILVDTKYEFGKDGSGRIVLVDELQTPDSSRFWLAATYDERHTAGEEPENIDKEFLRMWFIQNCNPYEDATLPDAPQSLISELSRRYLLLYELITGRQFDFTFAADGYCGSVTDAVEAFLAPPCT